MSNNDLSSRLSTRKLPSQERSDEEHDSAALVPTAEEDTWLEYFRHLARTPSNKSSITTGDSSSRGGNLFPNVLKDRWDGSSERTSGSSDGSILNELSLLQKRNVDINRQGSGPLRPSLLKQGSQKGNSLSSMSSASDANASRRLYAKSKKVKKNSARRASLSHDAGSRHSLRRARETSVQDTASTQLNLSVPSEKQPSSQQPSARSLLGRQRLGNTKQPEADETSGEDGSFKIQVEEVDDLIEDTSENSAPSRRSSLSRPVLIENFGPRPQNDDTWCCSCSPRQTRIAVIIVSLVLTVIGVAVGLLVVFGTDAANGGEMLSEDCLTGCIDGNGGNGDDGSFYDGSSIPTTPPSQNRENFMSVPPSDFPTSAPTYQNESDISDLTNSDIMLPSVQPTGSPWTEVLFEMHEKFSSITDPAKLRPDATTPQYEALKYLALKDPAKPSSSDEGLLQRYILTTFYFAMGGEGWTYSTNWLVRSDVCAWEGVHCKIFIEDKARRRIVTGLKLSRNNLVGVIPPEIGYLEHLEELLLYANDLVGVIPESIGYLTHLSSLSLGRNSLAGEIPTSIGNSTKLVNLLLNENKLNGTLPTQLGLLDKLEQLQCYGNVMRGFLPTELGKLTKLQRLWVSGNEFSGKIPREMGNMRNLRALYLDDNNMSGDLPPELVNASLLEDIRLYSNSFVGEIPETFMNLSQLRIMYLDMNRLNGTLPSWMGSLTDLEYLDLATNALHGTIPPAIGNLSKLVKLCLSRNNLTGEIPSTLAQLENLDELKLENNGIVGSVPEPLCAIGMTELSVDCNVICGCCDCVVDARMEGTVP